MDDSQLVLIHHFDKELGEKVRILRRNLDRSGFVSVETRQGVIESQVVSGAPLMTQEVFNYLNYAASIMFDAMLLGLEIRGAVAIKNELDKFLRAAGKITKKEILLMCEIQRPDNFPLHVCFAVHLTLADDMRLDAIQAIHETMKLIEGNVSRYREYEILVLHLDSSLKKWDLTNPKVYKRNHGISAWWSVRVSKAWGHAPKNDFPDKPGQSLWELVNGQIPDHVRRKALKVKSFYYQRICSVDDVKRALRVTPVQICVSIFESFMNAPNGKVKMPIEGEKRVGGHSVNILAYNDANQEFTFHNCWGSGWGDRGLGYLSYEYFNKYLIEAWGTQLEIRRWSRAISLRNFYRPSVWKNYFRDKKGFKALAKGAIKDKRGLILEYEALSVMPISLSKGYFFIINIFNPENRDKYDAWAHFSYDTDKKIIEVEELFVEEEQRGYGLGAQLLSLIEDIAKEWKVEKLVGWVSVIDAINEIEFGRLWRFFQKRGYNCVRDDSRYVGSLFRFEK
ncbi:hypothetical protein A2693_04275 [Candidatus Curtissbacteria bacterium RIFCSPHIGHO2_01_FULL_40_12]|uniref:N-acetyltransferase domain-containing protein n=1 Tax=Candidatus Curtissbacteria bacterium RIFCSPHIGHO2_01_FULL_40_12 TaxID=1797710 RepID=A0A1F5G9G0_9BACT|nr:MAG: hypothetical protein A2693_04275 [Candidatus Curtissbacteria bacterium RIFCSPHIGHO2_01_FULL_40_12]